jgi:5-methylcytosine-specific restriction endonuclease McrA
MNSFHNISKIVVETCKSEFLPYCVYSEKMVRQTIRQCEACGTAYHESEYWHVLGLCKSCRIPSLFTEARRVERHLKRAADLGLPVGLTFRQWIGTLSFFKWQCAYCPKDFACMDHYRPISKHGGTTANNCIPACIDCNNQKGDLHPEDLDTLFSTEVIDRIESYLDGL